MIDSHYAISALHNATDKYVDEYYDYYKEWLFDKPLITDEARVDELKEVGLILHKLIHYMGTHFVTDKFYKRMPVSDRVIEILNIFNEFDYDDIGTYRTDFVFDKQHAPKFIEITCQFALNAFYQAAVYNRYSQKYAQDHDLAAERVEDYDVFHTFMVAKLGARRSVCIIKGRDTIQASRFFSPIFKDAGLDVKEIQYSEVWAHKDFIKQSLVINECMMDEIETMSDDELRLLAQCKIVNDYRTIFIAHDKRFFCFLNDRDFQEKVLEPSEIKLLEQYLIKTHPCNEDVLTAQDVRDNKDAWVLKHINLGRSRQIFAGLEMNQAEWEELIRTLNYDEFVVQEWVPQKEFTGSVNGTSYNDYLTGTLLYFDSEYFGLGLFRASSHIIANKVDNRNIFPLVVKNTETIDQVDALAHF
tara:strand:+ start:535 stop:1779 length:1245 start_codon:yes stop_codon:yes gene_type:complete